MSFERILYRIVIAGLVFIIYMASRKIKWQEKTMLEQYAKNTMLQEQLEVQGKIDEH